ncbi:MAG: LptE family protein [Planctomycetota bacterium]|nr:LptE family protein [Planctomycetota bacterium]
MRLSRWFEFAVVALLLAHALGCGYTAASYRESDSRTIAVPIFENKTLWRGREFELTNAVAKNILTRTPFRIAPRDSADLVIEGEILDYETPGLLDDRVDRVLQSQISMRVKVKLTNRSGATITEKEKWFGAEFTTLRDESEATARAEIVEEAARWVVTCLETPW